MLESRRGIRRRRKHDGDKWQAASCWTAAWGRRLSIAAAKAATASGRWRRLYEDPELVRDIHIDYIRAGADVITTNTYGTTRVRMSHVDMEDRL